jgi:hypothetical protein
MQAVITYRHLRPPIDACHRCQALPAGHAAYRTSDATSAWRERCIPIWGGPIGRKKEVGKEYSGLDALEMQEWGRAGGPDRGGQCIHASTIVPTVPTIGTVEHDVGDN